MSINCVIMAGGTGGHVVPALAVAERLRTEQHRVVWLGTRQGIEARMVAAANFDIRFLDVHGVRRSGWQRKITLPLMLLQACWQAYRHLRAIKPQVVLGMGGFVAGPGGLMARLMGIPLVVHEQNACAGVTNRLLARVATRVLSGFANSTGLATASWVGNPVPASIARMANEEQAIAAKNPVNVLVLGGSQGAAVFNQQLPGLLAKSSISNLALHHQCGNNKQDGVIEAYANHGIDAKVSEFIDDMAAAYQWADVVICRSGAMTVAELASAGKPALLVPYPYAVSDHQFHNAAALQQAGAALCIRQQEFLSGEWLGEFAVILSDAERRGAMAAAAKSLAKPEAAAVVADTLLEVAHA